MNFRRQSPGETGPKGTITWTALKLEPGTHEDVFTLGSCLWFWSHWRGRSVPCYAEFTNGKEQCPHCGTRDYWQGYLPVCNEVGMRYLVLVKESNKPVIDKFQVGQSVMVAIKKGKGEPYTVRPAMRRQVRPPTEMDERALASIESALVVIWRDQFFKDWFATNGKPDDAFGLALRASMLSRKQADKSAQDLMAAVKDRIKVREKLDSDNAVSIGDVLPHVNGVERSKKK